jgi:hypothetical protein
MNGKNCISGPCGKDYVCAQFSYGGSGGGTVLMSKTTKGTMYFNNTSKKKSSNDLTGAPISTPLVTSSTGKPTIPVPISDLSGSSSSSNGLEAIGSVELKPLQFVIEVVGDIVYKTEEDRIKNNGSLFANWTMVFSGGFLGDRKMTQVMTMPSVMPPNHRFQFKISDSVFSGQDMPYDDRKYLSDAYFRVGKWNEIKTIFELYVYLKIDVFDE